MKGFGFPKKPLTFLLFMIAAWTLSWQSTGLAAVPCKKMILVAPPPMADLKLSGWLMQEAKAAYFRSMKWDCAPFYKKSVSSELFDYLGTDARDPNTIQTRQLEFIKERTGAGQIMFLSFESKRSILKLSLYNLVEEDGEDLKAVIDGEFEIDVDAKAVSDRRANILRFVMPYLTPNSFSLGLSSVKAVVRPAEGYEETYSVNRSTLPAFISSIQITKIDHPDSFGLFDISFSIFPGFFFFALDQYTGVQNTNAPGDSRQTLHMQAFGSNANLNGELTVHTPIGSSYFSVGAGPSYYAQKQENEEPKTILSPFDLRVRAGHRAFVTKNAFFSLDADQMFLSKNLYFEEGVAEAKSLIRLSASIGWYFPTSSFYY